MDSQYAISLPIYYIIISEKRNISPIFRSFESIFVDAKKRNTGTYLFSMLQISKNIQRVYHRAFPLLSINIEVIFNMRI